LASERKKKDMSEPDFWELKEKGDVKGLIKALGYREDSFVRYRAVSTLRELKVESALSAFIELLGKEDDPSVWRCAAEGLKEMGWVPTEHDVSAARYWVANDDLDQAIECGVVAVGPLIGELMSDSSESVGLHRIGVGAIPPLVAAANSLLSQFIVYAEAIGNRLPGPQDSKIIKSTVSSLENCLNELVAFEVEDIETELATMYATAREKIPVPRQGLMDDVMGFAVRGAIAAAAGRSGGPTGIKVAVDATMNDPDMFARWEAADQILHWAESDVARVKDAGGVEALGRLIEDMEEVIRKEGALRNQSHAARLPHYREVHDALAK
jgi:hypothetical protein